jgi:hypothetical protein
MTEVQISALNGATIALSKDILMSLQIFISQVGGAINRVPADATAYTATSIS